MKKELLLPSWMEERLAVLLGNVGHLLGTPSDLHDNPWGPLHSGKNEALLHNRTRRDYRSRPLACQKDLFSLPHLLLGDTDPAKEKTITSFEQCSKRFLHKKVQFFY